ncbi:hypothetical protein COCC4DRAFT_207761 [Bipolaris maydis ATCC 48331]|uniref:Uncharacterized protein n=2 Tax=Cochliobolus heterostrophus TaxID=5016 RepID=M2UCR5_COCH5|nr:uncharacterized protein COCC4DRAFT_207761 [Bipolaris maydis ATCC 48331]EMD85707.1 hypothetical protein COCHEDRAFT_1198659 [Bipolaris maydis C5]KAJ6208543.1 hypothetical protein PSV09DRAFT_1198659 [Bipolaris maydis]ENH99577.1 hypothetical protein COCC4DRAFT_207761 [Bipolaris maydis ATCC 48331]KAJ6273045.1 hypothetical protein PSV08DRAFT_219918 [Bipolaris maydis]KAJ6284143.1 hypothetical protein J3E71DRAFT_351525 [Bipolaris maydis]
MAQDYSPARSVWIDLWQEKPALYITLQSTAIINNALLSLLLIAIFSVIYDAFRFWISRRTRQTCHYQVVDGTVGDPATKLLDKLVRDTSGSPMIVAAKATFHSTPFVCVQYMTSQSIVHVARWIASTSMTNKNMKRRCSRLLDRGVECSAVLHYHTPLNIVAAVILLCIIRGFQLHVKSSKCRAQDTNYSPGFLKLLSTCRCIAQRILALQIAVIHMYTPVLRETPWRYMKLLVVQASASWAIFVTGNLICLLAALPDFQGTMEVLEESGITGSRG